MRHSIYVAVCEFLVFQMLLMCGCVGVGNLLVSPTILHHWVCSGCVVVQVLCIVLCWSAEIICLLGVCVVRKIEMLFEFVVRVFVCVCVCLLMLDMENLLRGYFRMLIPVGNALILVRRFANVVFAAIERID